MVTYLRHQKEKYYWSEIKKILDSQFDGNINYVKEAENIFNKKKNNTKTLKNMNNILSSIKIHSEGNIKNKTSCLDLINEKAYIMYPLEQTALLAYSLTDIGYRRLFPSNISSVINRNIQLDKNNAKNKEYSDNVNSINNFLKIFLNNYKLNVTTIQKDQNNGTIQFETNQSDPVLGICRQYMTIVIDKNQKFALNNIKNNVGNLAKDYKSLFAYFALFGFSEIYSRCTCTNYLSKFSKKRGMQNYTCNHLFYSMSLFPYYVLYAL